MRLPKCNPHVDSLSNGIYSLMTTYRMKFRISLCNCRPTKRNEISNAETTIPSHDIVLLTGLNSIKTIVLPQLMLSLYPEHKYPYIFVSQIHKEIRELYICTVPAAKRTSGPVQQATQQWELIHRKWSQYCSPRGASPGCLNH